MLPICASPPQAQRGRREKENRRSSPVGVRMAFAKPWWRLGGATKPEKPSLAEERRLDGDEDRG